ncbi:MAG: hypothetical protein EB034_24505, partial [Verrucomicrobia bacterium]|nr:hypothetical protein [Verrucomicrobiota bacterium]
MHEPDAGAVTAKASGVVPLFCHYTVEKQRDGLLFAAALDRDAGLVGLLEHRDHCHAGLPGTFLVFYMQQLRGVAVQLEAVERAEGRFV